MTLVTALFDLAGREPGIERRTPDDYFEAGDFVLGLDQDLVVFADPPLADELVRRREAAGLGARTRVVAVELERLPAYNHLRAIERARREHPIVNADPDKDTALYVVCVWSKFELLRRALELDPQATHFAWIDFGITARPHPDDGVFERPPDRVRLLRMRGFDSRDVADPVEYFARIRGHLAAGYMPGSRAAIAELADRFDALAAGMLEDGFAHNVEPLLVPLALENPELFEFIHGDYDALLLNQSRLRGSAPNLHFQLRDARERDVSEHAIRLCAAIVESLRDGVLESDPATLALILDECYLVAWYWGDPEHRLARELADRLRDLVDTEPGARDLFLREEVRIRGNLALLGERP